MTLTRRILWTDDDDAPAPSPPSPVPAASGLEPIGIGIWGVLQARPGPGDELRIPGVRVPFTFDPAATPVPAPPVPPSFSGRPSSVSELVPLGMGIWGNLQTRPQPGDSLR